MGSSFTRVRVTLVSTDAVRLAWRVRSLVAAIQEQYGLPCRGVTLGQAEDEGIQADLDFELPWWILKFGYHPRLHLDAFDAVVSRWFNKREFNEYEALDFIPADW